jgi:hypothetical protein
MSRHPVLSQSSQSALRQAFSLSFAFACDFRAKVLSASSACSALIVSNPRFFYAPFAAFAAIVVLLLDGSAHAQQLPTAIPQTKFVSGQDIQPYFEGWIRNADGSFDMVFGYFNRNWQEELAIPAGPDNIVEPGEPDRGQPTYFLPVS